MEDKILYPRYLIRKKICLKLLKEHYSELDNFLEIGSGRGDFVRSLAQVIKEGDLVDFSAEAVEILKEKFKADKIQIILGDFLNLEFTKKYSLIVMFEVLEHLKADAFALKKINSLLKDNGIFLFSVPARMKYWGTTDYVAGHYRRYEKEDLVKLLEEANFKIVNFISYEFPILNLVSKLRDYLLKRNLNKIKKYETKEGFSRKSGLGLTKYFALKKIVLILNQIFFNNALISLYIFLLKPFNKSNLGDGYICLVRK